MMTRQVVAKEKPSLCTDQPLDDPATRQKVRALRHLLTSCYGPTGRLKHVHNNIGGHVTTTSTSSVLLRGVSSSHPLVKLISASVLNHVSRFSDCGLFTALLCLSLIDQTKRSGIRRRNVAIDVNRHLLDVCTSYLRQSDCGCKVELDFTSSRGLITVARSVLSSKPACVLTEPETLHMSRLAVQAFLLAIPCGDCPGGTTDTVTLGEIVTVSVEGHTVMDSAVFPGLLPGLLVDVPDVLHHSNVEENLAGPLQMVLFTVSLSGDLSDLGEWTLEMHEGGADSESLILDHLLELGKRMVEDEMKIFACQKVIHPVLQHYLRHRGIVVMERLGIALIQPLCQITGAQPVATLHGTIPPEAYGRVKGLSIRHFGSKTMLHLHPLGEPAVCTLILCHRNETMLSELKVAWQKTEHVLRLTLREPSALLGGGCTETHLAAYIRNKGLKEATQAAALVGCSQVDYLLGLEAFCSSLESVARALEHNGGNPVIDLINGHLWIIAADVQSQRKDSHGPCGCGLVEKLGEKWTYLNTKHSAFSPEPVSTNDTIQPNVLDSFTAKVNALQVAVETANLVLDIGYIIQDVN